MSLIAYLIIVFVTGLFVGGLARLALPGPDPMTLIQTAAVGVVGSLLAGLISLGLFHHRGGAGILLSVLCSVGLVWLIRQSRYRRSGSRSFAGRR